eukprot:4699928-Alexandrium_andersonii.AAC.1
MQTNGSTQGGLGGALPPQKPAVPGERRQQQTADALSRRQWRPWGRQAGPRPHRPRRRRKGGATHTHRRPA